MSRNRTSLFGQNMEHSLDRLSRAWVGEFGKPSVAYSPRLGVEKDELFRPTCAVPGLRKKALSR